MRSVAQVLFCTACVNAANDSVEVRAILTPLQYKELRRLIIKSVGRSGLYQIARQKFGKKLIVQFNWREE